MPFKPFVYKGFYLTFFYPGMVYLLRQLCALDGERVAE